MKHVFKKPYQFEGQTYTEIEINLDDLKGSDISRAKKNFFAEGNYAPQLYMDSDFCAHLASIASKQPIDFFENLPAREYSSITQGVSNFLLM